MHPLDRLVDRDIYGKFFTDVAYWMPYVHQVCTAHGLPCRQVETSTPGSFPVFIVDRQVVLKFFGPLFGGERSYTVEIEADRLLQKCPSVPAARVLFFGRLDPPGANWDWPYLGFEYLAGQNIGKVFQHILDNDRLSLAGQLGGWVRLFHSLELTGEDPFENRWDEFEKFLLSQRRSCAERQAGWGSLPGNLVAQIEDFIPAMSTLLDRTQSPHVIHADLTGDHLIGQFQDGHWVTSGLIDFGDARVGNLYYELAALHTDMLRGDRRMLAAFLKGYGIQPPQDFPRLALSYCLLHEFNMFTICPAWFPPSLEELARQLWEI